jgi:hypothetical protein
MSCHEMHPSADDPTTLEEWANDQLAPGMDGDARACSATAIRGSRSSGAALASRHGLDGSSHDCDMPHTSYGLLKAIRAHEVSSPDVSVTLATGRPNACNLCHLDRTLEWTAEHLHDWYGQDSPESLREGKGLDEDEKTVAASILALLRGDAGLRALIAWHYAWQPALAVSGSAWQAPYLGELLADPYDAVRFIAGRSLQTLPGFDHFAYEFLAPPAERKRAVDLVRTAWKSSHGLPETRELLIGADGDLLRPSLERFLAQREPA